MEKFPSDSVLKNVEDELTQGAELAKQLQLQLNAQFSSHETLVYLLDEILNSYDRVLSKLKYGGTGGVASSGASPRHGVAMAAIMSDSPVPPISGSPHSDDSDQEDQADRKSGEKGVKRWTQKIVVRGEMGNETQLGDGHTWRKYGQKDIQRSKYPRGYYRCTHRYRKGCLAKRQVQRLDEDPTTFEVTYKGLHTCYNNPPIPIIHPQNEPKTISSHQNLNQSQTQQEPSFNIQTSLRVIDNNNDNQLNIPSSSDINPKNNPNSDDDLLMEDYLVDYPATPDLNFFNNYEMIINNSQDVESAVKPPAPDVGDSSFDSSSGFGLNFGFGN